MSHDVPTVLPKASASWKSREPSTTNFSVSRAPITMAVAVKLP